MKRNQSPLAGYEVVIIWTKWKLSKYGVFPGPYFPAFGLNTEIFGVNKIRTRKNYVFGHFSRSDVVVKSKYVNGFKQNKPWNSFLALVTPNFYHALSTKLEKYGAIDLKFWANFYQVQRLKAVLKSECCCKISKDMKILQRFLSLCFVQLLMKFDPFWPLKVA